MRRGSWCVCMLAVALLALVTRASATYCELSDEPVCGEDGIEYTNACIAGIQGVRIAYDGECGSQSTGFEESTPSGGIIDTGVYISRSLRITKGRVSYATILQYASADYRFVGLYERKNGTIPSQQLVCTQSDEEAASKNPRRLLAGIRDPNGQKDGQIQPFTQDKRGGVYRQSPVKDGKSKGSGSGPYFPKRSRSRSLLSQRPVGSIGSNDIKTVDLGSRLSPPYSAVLKFAVAIGGKRTVCTGALIGRNTLLTAAHCVYDQAGLFFYNYDYYRFYTADLKLLDVKIEDAVVSVQYSLGLDEYDFALITLDKNFSNTLGYLGYGDACEADCPDVSLYGFNVPNNNKFSSSTCKLPTTCNKIIAEEQCDVVPGMSGGPLVNSHDIINAIAIGSCGGEFNQAVLLQKLVVAFIDDVIKVFE